MPVATPSMDPDVENQLNKVFAALSDSTRRSIVTRLTEGEATMSEIAAPFELTLPGVTKHVAVLEAAGLVRKWKSGRVRRCRLEPEPIQLATGWLRSRTEFWTETLDSLAAFVEQEEPSE